MKKNFFMLFVAGVVLAMTGCKEKENDNPSGDGGMTGKAVINSISIANAGMSGGDKIAGVVDNENYTVVFSNVPAESDLSAVRFEAGMPLGAKLDKDVYNFFEGNDPNGKTYDGQVSVIISVTDAAGKVTETSQAYKVTINLADPASAPILDKLLMKDENGTEYKATLEDGILMLNMPQAEYAVLSEIVLIPKRASYLFSAMGEDGRLLPANPGKLTISFMGLTTEYEIAFAASSAIGVDFSKAVVHDFSVATGNMYPDYAGMMIRGGDFDGEYVLLPHQTAPRLLKVSDLLNNNAANPINLSMTGVDHGAFLVSAGRLSHGHVYLCNLAVMNNGEYLRVYYYDSPTSEPQMILNWDGSLSDGGKLESERRGDNMSVNLDESGNGYLYFAGQDVSHGATNIVLRFTVTGFTNVSSSADVIELPAPAAYYGQYNQVGPNEYLFTSSYVPTVWLLDADGNEKAAVEFDWTENDARPNHGVDPRIVEFNRARYMLFTVANSQPMHWNFGPVFYIFDITDGFDNQSAMVKLGEAMAEETFEPDWQYFLTTPDLEYGTQSTAPAAQAAACELNGKLVIFTAAANAGFAIIEVPMAQ